MDAQTWLNQTIPVNQRGNIRKLLISIPAEQNIFIHQSFYADYHPNKYYLADTLTGTLDLSTFPKLSHLIIEYQRLTGLDLRSNRRLRDIDASNNLLQTIIFPQVANRLYQVHVLNNNLQARDLSVFTNYPRLRYLILGTNKLNRIRQGLYNRWQGSLRPLSNLTRLEELDINATDISHGLQFLSLDNLQIFTCGNQGRNNALVNNIKMMLGLSEAAAIEDADPITITNKIQQLINWQRIFQFIRQRQTARILQIHSPLFPRN